MITFPKKIILLYFLLFGFSNFSQGQNTLLIEFNAEGKMTVAPPNTLPNGEILQLKVNIDVNSYEKKILGIIENYFTTLNTIQKSPIYEFFLLESEELKKFKCSLGGQIKSLSEYLSKDQKAVIINRLENFDLIESCPNPDLGPEVRKMVDPIYFFQVSFHDKNGSIVSNNLPIIDTLRIEGVIPSDLKYHSYISRPVTIPKNTASILFELREKNLLNQKIQKTADLVNKDQIKVLEFALKEIKTKLNEAFFFNYSLLEARAKIAQNYLKDPTSQALDQNWLVSTETLFQNVEKPVNIGIKSLESATVQEWIVSWLWLTNGTPKTNPFSYQVHPLFPKNLSSTGKVSEKDKFLIEIFDTMVKNSAFQVNDISGIFKDEQLGLVAEIKGKLKAEGLPVASPIEYDRFLYSGSVKTFDDKYILEDLRFFRSSVPLTYMVSHNADQDFLLMSNIQKEIKDTDQLFVSLQNKKPSQSFNLEVISTPIENDVSYISEEIEYSAYVGDKIENEELPLYKGINNFYKRYLILTKKVEFLSSLQAPPTLPLIFLKDETPELKTEIMNYNQNLKSPAVSEYKIKSGIGEDEKEVYKGEFRINKLYNLRFKAGIVYSDLLQKDYTKSGDNTFTEEINQAGLDGTFGIQIFPIKTDLRQINITKGRVAPFVYMGFSMKNILENFYPGIGLEIFSGLSVSYNRHIGISEVLISENSLPQSIETKWKGGNSISVLVDGALFVNLFKFGSNKSYLGL